MKPVIIGAGLAGMTVALSLAPMPAILVSSQKLGSASSSAWAQGGLAASLGADDSAEQHAADTVKVGGGLCDTSIVQSVTKDAARAIEQLIGFGALFDRDAAGHLALGLEAAHSRRRIVHAGDRTGTATIEALTAAIQRCKAIEVIEDAAALDLSLDEQGAINGVTIGRNGRSHFLAADKVILATGGIGALWRHTTNPLNSRGHGLALAARAGAVFGDLEFMQFHPTAIDIGRDPMPLASEALRGEGAKLINDQGDEFVYSLAPRDVVARAIGSQYAKCHKVFLDLRSFKPGQFAQCFPHIHALCLDAGISELIPVRPAAHYHMGGVVTDPRGRTHVEGLWACGETANTGLHGANRLASNSLLEAAVFGRRVAEDILGLSSSPARAYAPAAASSLKGERKGNCVAGRGNMDIRVIMSNHVGLLRDKAGLTAAIQQLTPLAQQSDEALVGLMIATAAHQRCESRGAHSRIDYPQTASAAQRSTLMLQDVLPPPQRRAI